MSGKTNQKFDGARVRGDYFGVDFAGRVTHIEPNWEQGSGNAVNLLVQLDAPAVTPSGQTRDSLWLQKVNQVTGAVGNGSSNVRLEFL